MSSLLSVVFGTGYYKDICFFSYIAKLLWENTENNMVLGRWHI